MEYISHSEQDTFDIAKNILEHTLAPYYFLLYGDLGVGKTHFSKALLECYGVDKDEVHSPTFNYVKQFTIGNTGEDQSRGQGNIKNLALGLGATNRETSLVHGKPQAISKAFHFDLYRLEDIQEADYFIIEHMEQFQNALVCIEWSERLSDNLKKKLREMGFKTITFEEKNNGHRSITLHI